jgi:RND family efflux transporter MFP subunit
MRTTHASRNPAQRGSILRKFLTVVLPVLVIAGGVAIALVLIRTSPRSTPRPPQRTARLVETLTVELGPQPTLIRAHGTVQPAREVTVYPRVGGEIVAISPNLIPGGRFEKGETLLTIDPIDFQLAVHQRQTDVSAAKADLALEMGQQTVAVHEYALLGETISDENRDLVLRQPQLAQAEAALASAEWALDLAELDLERTTVKAPFNAILRARNVNAGMQVTTVTALGTVTGSDDYWVELTVPVHQLKWIQVPRDGDDRGSLVRVWSQSSAVGDAYREGTVLRLLPDLEPNGRLARLLVLVRDPLALRPEHKGKPTLLLGDYVSAEIEGVGLPSAVALDRSFFRDGDQVWLMTPDRQLERRPVEVTFRSMDSLLVTSGLRTGEQVIMTDLPAAVEGMALRTAEDPVAASPRDESNGGPGAGGGGPRP